MSVSVDLYTYLVVWKVYIYQVEASEVLDRLLIVIGDTHIVEDLHSHFLVSGDLRFFSSVFRYSIKVGFSLTLSFYSVVVFFSSDFGLSFCVSLHRLEVVSEYFDLIAKTCLDLS